MRRLFWLVAATFPVAVVSALTWFGVFVFVNAYLIRGLGWTNAAYTVAILTMSVAMFFWYPFCTELSARLGRRWTVALTSTASGLAYAILPFSDRFWPIQTAMALLGAGTAGYLVGWTPFVAEAGGDRPGRAMVLATLVLNLVGMVSLIAGGLFMDTVNYRAAFLTLSAVCIACAVAFLAVSRRFEAVIQAENAASGLPQTPLGAVSIRGLQRQDVAELVRGPFLLVVLLGICAAPFAYQSSNALFPNLSRDVHGMDERTIAILVGMGRVPSGIALLLALQFIDRIRAVRLYAVGLVLDGLAILCIAHAPSAGTAGAA
ncbi:MAG: MFS transporter, partial [Candidatus Hydrogenedentes bacterium]|nr:MFS transporter [Candidatus Hydrogenedentota bacterium]